MAPESSSSAPSKGGMSSLYANLLDPSANDDASITRAPVVFKQTSTESATQEEANKQQSNTAAAAALRFQPNFRRPQPNSNQRSKAKAPVVKPVTAVSALDLKPVAETSQKPSSNNLARWTSLDDDDDVNGFYADKPQRGGRKKRKKNKQDSAAIIRQDWDDIYDPARPNNYEEFKNSEERYRDIRDWKDRLYAHRYAREAEDLSDSEEDSRPVNRQFAPPPPSAFALPPSYDDTSPPPPPPSVPAEAASGEDAFARRAQFSQAPAPPSSSGPSLSRAPVRYAFPPAPDSNPTPPEDPTSLPIPSQEPPSSSSETTPRSLLPGQSNFATRLLKKYGWTAGSGLGAADNEGILNPLRVKVEKTKRKSDAEGGGLRGPRGKGVILGGKRAPEKGGKEEAVLSEVVVLAGMVEGVDLSAEGELEGLVQEIGDECAEKYGRVERVYIHSPLDQTSPRVFVKFTSQLSALRAVAALQGRIFNGNAIEAMYYPAEAFEGGNFDL
ncbi:MAG: hypothetical protein M1814_000458 [Vezdaea aestivalis]|nr:MAG: hypothetical protein M1814_000458 [Vezdaea aestivalis]